MRDKSEYNRYVIKNKKMLNDIQRHEYLQYREYMYKSSRDWLLGKIKNDNVVNIMKWQHLSRLADYYDFMYHKTGSYFYLIFYILFVRRRNTLGNKIGLELSTALIGKGLKIYHFNNVINSGAIIGENLHLHGCNVIGNAGNGDLRCPIIGNNVMMGAGAKVIGNVTIADNIKIAAGAVVVNSFTEPGITIGGVPARRLK